VPCPAIANLVTDMQEVMARALIEERLITKKQARAAFNALQWMTHRRKTTANTEERGLQEKVTRIFRGLKVVIMVEGDAEEWRKRAWDLGAAIQDLVWFL
jgi:hypothetical protein